MRTRSFLRIGIFGLGVLLFVSGIFGEVEAQVTASLPDASGDFGTSVSIPVDVTDVTGLGIFSAGIEITYGSDILLATGATTVGTIAGGWGDPTVNTSEPGRVVIGMAGTSALSGSGALVFINFDVVGVGTTGLIFENMFFNEGDPPVATVDGSFEGLPVEPPPVAEFSGTPTSGDRPLLVEFTDLSTGAITGWSWTFGDGGTGSAQHPSHTYTAVGTYTVSLTVTGPGGSDTEEKVDYITVSEPPPPPPVAAFSGSPTSGYRPLLVEFTDESTGVIDSWSWDFGDGGTSTAQHPSHTYTAVGTYTVSLTVTGPGGSDTETKTDYITVLEAPVEVIASLPDASGDFGTSVSIPVDVTDVTGLGIFGVGIQIAYGSDILLATGGTTVGTIAEGWGDPTVNTSEPGRVVIGMAGTSALSGSGVLVFINFDVVGVGTTGLIFENMFFNEGDPPVTTVDGSFTGLGDLPEIVVDVPSPLDVTLDVGEILTIDPGMIVRNVGGGVLDFEISEALGVLGESASSRVAYRELGDVEGTNAEGAKAGKAAVYRYEGIRQEPTVVLYTSDWDLDPGNTLADRGLQRLGISYTGYYADPSGFSAALAGDPDVALIDCPSNQPYWSDVEAYIGRGGKVAISTWSPPASLFAAMGVTPIVSIDTLPVYWWDPTSHPVFTSPDVVPEFTDMVDDSWADNGDKVEPLGGSVAIGGFTPSPVTNEAGVVIGNEGRTIMNSFLVTDNNETDLDSDGVPDAVELWGNQAMFLLGAAVDVPWLSADPTGGSLPGGAHEDIAVTFDATDLEGGRTWFARLIVASNDPDEPEIEVPVSLTTRPQEPDIEVSPESLEQTLVVGESAVQTLTIGNVGNGDLTYSITDVEGEALSLGKKGEKPPADRREAPFVPGELLVKFKPGTGEGEIRRIHSEIGAQAIKVFRLIGVHHLKVSGISVEGAVSAYEKNPNVEYAEPNYIVKADALPDDPMFDDLWGLHNTGQTGGTSDADVDAPEAWNIRTGGSILVGVIDTGVDYTHPDLAANTWTNPGEIPGNGIDDDENGFIDDIKGWDFVNGDNDPLDDNGHGTHVSGTIAAIGNNGLGVVGVSWTGQIMALKFLDAGGSGSTADAIDAIEYATLMGARVMSNSWGGGGFSSALRDAIVASSEAGAVFVAAAGNDGLNNDVYPHYPSSYDVPNIISVAATNHNDLLAGWSNYGPTSVDLAAPGVNILSTLPSSSYGAMGGTSMATPHVSGVAALLFAESPTLTNLEVKTQILGTVDPKESLIGKLVTEGRLNAFNALEGLEQGWLSEFPTSGTIPPGGSDDIIEVTFDAAELAPDTYTADIIVSSNDPDEPEVIVPVTLTVVTDVPAVPVSIPSDAFGPAGGTVYVPVNVDDDVTGLGIFAAGMTLAFNADVLSAESASVAGTIAEGWTLEFNPTEASEGRIAIGMAGAAPLEGSGPLVFVRFHVVGAPGSTSDIVFEEFFFNEGDPPADTEDGFFTVGPPVVVRTFPYTGGLAYVHSSPTVVFSEAMDPASFDDASSMTTVGDVSGPISGTIRYDEPTQSASFVLDPGVSLTEGETVTVTVSGDVQDLWGNGLDGNYNGISEGSPVDDYVWTFVPTLAQTLVAYPTTAPPTLDGVIDPGEYDDAVPVAVDFEHPTEMPGIVPDWIPLPTGPEDLSYTVYAVYDATDLYVTVDVTDDAIQDDSDLAWQDDDLELYVDGDRVSNDVCLDWDHAAGKEGFQVIIDVGGDIAEMTGGVLHYGTDWFAESGTREGGRVHEFRIPLTSIDMTDGPGESHPAARSRFGFNIVAADDDNGGPPYEDPDDSYGAWTGSYDQWRWNGENDWGVMYLSPSVGWEAQLTLTGEEIGEASNISEAFIGIADEASTTPPAPAPPEYTARIVLYAPDLSGPFGRDIRAAGSESELWILDIDPHGNMPPPPPPPPIPRDAELSWDPSQFDPDPALNYRLVEGTDETGPTVVSDMRAETSYVVTGTSPVYYSIICGREVPFVFELPARGWYLVSLPVIPTDPALDALFPDADVAYWYIPPRGPYTEVTELEPAKGYWVHLTEGGSYTIRGGPFADYTASLSRGWSMMGAVLEVSAPTTDPPDQVDVMYGYIAPRGPYYEATELAPGEGYWVHATSDCEFIVGPPAAAGAGAGEAKLVSHSPIRRDSRDSDWGALIKVRGHAIAGVPSAVDLYIGVSGAGHTLGAPPPPPEFTAHAVLLSDDLQNGLYKAIRPQGTRTGMWTIAVNPQGNVRLPEQGAATIRWDALSLGEGTFELREGLGGTGAIVVPDMKATTSYDVRGDNRDYYYTILWESGTARRPEEYMLSQNYPNPFNPATSIRYRLPYAGKVKLGIYDLLGRQVKALVDVEQAAGYYEVKWDGRDDLGREVATGIYLYRIEAGRFVRSRKMVLLR